ncbi:TPA: hypothetical protein ACXP61_004991 [Klebsiella pneumoniae]
MTVKLKGITLPDTLTYPKLQDFQLFSVMEDTPIKTGLVGSYFVGSKNADPNHNFANPALPLLTKLNPDISDSRFALLSALTGYFDTQIPSSSTQSFVAIVRVPSATSAILANYTKDTPTTSSGDVAAININTDATKTLGYYVQTSSTGTSPVTRSLNDFSAGDFAVVGGVISSNLTVSAWTMSETASPAASTSGAFTQHITNGRTLRIGATYLDNRFTGKIGISSLVLYNQDIGSAGMVQVMNWMRNTVGVQAGIWNAPKS